MLEAIVAVIAGCTVFFLFMLVFMRRDDQGQRGRRLAGCRHHTPGEGCDRCHNPQAATIHPHPIEKTNAAVKLQNKADPKITPMQEAKRNRGEKAARQDRGDEP